MYRHLSVLKLYIRSSIYKVLLLLAGMAAVEGSLFVGKLEALLREAAALQGEMLENVTGTELMLELEGVLESSQINRVFYAFVVLVTVVLCLNGCERGGKQGYTLQRLSVSEKTVVLWQSLCNAGFYFLLWMVQAVTAFCICKWYVYRMDVSSNQAIFLAFYRSAFLHNLLPLEEVGLWVRNVLLVITFGLVSGCVPYRQRRGKLEVDIIFLFWASIIWCSRDLGSIVSDAIAIGACVIVIGVKGYQLYFREEVPHEA